MAAKPSCHIPPTEPVSEATPLGSLLPVPQHFVILYKSLAAIAASFPKVKSDSREISLFNQRITWAS